RRYGHTLRIVRPSRRVAVSKTREGRARNGLASESCIYGRFGGSRARPLVLQSAAAVWRQQCASRRTLACVTEIRSAQHGQPLFSRRAPGGPGTKRGGTRRMASRDRRAAQSRVGARGSGIPGQSENAARKASCRLKFAGIET